MKKYLVETISQHRVRYVVEAREEEHALDEVTLKCEEWSDGWEELSQKHLGDVIISSREVDEEEVLRIFDEDNDYLRSWDRSTKLKVINTIVYDDKEIVPDEREWEYDGLGNRVYRGTMKTYDK